MMSMAFEIARDAHEGQIYGEDTPYIDHPVAAAEIALELGYPDEVVSACLLHDVIEDTELTADRLREYEFPESVIAAVVAVTYKEEDEEMGIDKIEKAKSNPLGHVTKFCDSSSNFAASITDPARGNTEKYASFVAQLERGLPTPEEIRAYLVQY